MSESIEFVVPTSEQLVVDGLTVEIKPLTVGQIGRAMGPINAVLKALEDGEVLAALEVMVSGAEAADMVWALSTGHRGGFSTCHAGGPADALARLETLCLMGAAGVPHRAVRAQVRSAVDALVGVARGRDGCRRITAVHAVGPTGLGDDLLAGLGA